MSLFKRIWPQNIPENVKNRFKKKDKNSTKISCLSQGLLSAEYAVTWQHYYTLDQDNWWELIEERKDPSALSQSKLSLGS